MLKFESTSCKISVTKNEKWNNKSGTIFYLLRKPFLLLMLEKFFGRSERSSFHLGGLSGYQEVSWTFTALDEKKNSYDVHTSYHFKIQPTQDYMTIFWKTSSLKSFFLEIAKQYFSYSKIIASKCEYSIKLNNSKLKTRQDKIWTCQVK